MGLFKKIKDIFYDEEIVDVPIEEPPRRKKEEEKRKPVIEEIVSEPIPKPVVKEPVESIRSSYTSERELFKSDKTFDFPVFEDEEDELPKTRSKTNVLELQRELEQRTISTRLETPERVNDLPETKSKFKPSPIISPVYGILDKNYKKEQVMEKKEPVKPYTGEMNYDFVRRKAYGTLEDELEDTLTRVNSEIAESVDELEKEIENLPKPSQNIEKLLGEIEKNASVSIGELEEIAKEEMMQEEESEDTLEFSEELEETMEILEKPEEKEEEPDIDETLEHDLFNLIDSMYEEREE